MCRAGPQAVRGGASFGAGSVRKCGAPRSETYKGSPFLTWKQQAAKRMRSSHAPSIQKILDC